MKNIKTVELVKELLRRVEHVDAVLDLVDSRVAVFKAPKAKAAPRYSKTHAKRMTAERFLEIAKQAGGPRSGLQLSRVTNISQHAAVAHANRLEVAGKMRRVPNTFPILYEVVT